MIFKNKHVALCNNFLTMYNTHYSENCVIKDHKNELQKNVCMKKCRSITTVLMQKFSRSLFSIFILFLLSIIHIITLSYLFSHGNIYIRYNYKSILIVIIAIIVIVQHYNHSQDQ